MQVGRRRMAGVPDQRNALAPTDPLVLHHQDLQTMAIPGAITMTMRNDDEVPVKIVNGNIGNRSRSGGDDSACRSPPQYRSRGEKRRPGPYHSKTSG